MPKGEKRFSTLSITMKLGKCRQSAAVLHDAANPDAICNRIAAEQRSLGARNYLYLCTLPLEGRRNGREHVTRSLLQNKAETKNTLPFPEAVSDEITRFQDSAITRYRCRPQLQGKQIVKFHTKKASRAMDGAGVKNKFIITWCVGCEVVVLRNRALTNQSKP